MGDLLGAVAWGAVEHDEQVVLGIGLGELLEEHLQTSIVHPRQIHAEALSRRRLHRGVQVGPFVGAPHDVGRAEPFGTVASTVPVDEPETRLVEGKDLQRLPTVTLSASLEGGGEVF